MSHTWTFPAIWKKLLTHNSQGGQIDHSKKINKKQVVVAMLELLEPKNIWIVFEIGETKEG